MQQVELTCCEFFIAYKKNIYKGVPVAHPSFNWIDICCKLQYLVYCNMCNCFGWEWLLKMQLSILTFEFNKYKSEEVKYFCERYNRICTPPRNTYPSMVQSGQRGAWSYSISWKFPGPHNRITTDSRMAQNMYGTLFIN